MKIRVSGIEVRVIEGSSYRESTVFNCKPVSEYSFTHSII